MKLDVIYNKSSQRMDELPDESIDMVMTSPPYWGLRDYGIDGQLGLEPTFQLYLDHMTIVCAEIKRVLKKTGSFWLNMGDTYSGSGKGYGSVDPKYVSARDTRNRITPNRLHGGLPNKCLIGIPWRLVLRLIDEQNWILRNAIIWHKPNAMPSSVKDRCSNSYEFLFHLIKVKKYYYDLDAIREPHKNIEQCRLKVRRHDCASEQYSKSTHGPDDYHPSGKNPGDVWTINTQPRPEAHFATFPDKLCIKPILATCLKDTGILLDPFAGRGTSLIMAKKLGRHYIGYELKKEYADMAKRELEEIDPLFRSTK